MSLRMSRTFCARPIPQVCAHVPSCMCASQIRRDISATPLVRPCGGYWQNIKKSVGITRTNYLKRHIAIDDGLPAGDDAIAGQNESIRTNNRNQKLLITNYAQYEVWPSLVDAACEGRWISTGY